MKFELRIYDATQAEINAFLAGTSIHAINANIGTHTISSPVTTVTDQNEEDGATNVNAPSVDSTGLPWDERIHAKTKAQNADGTWRGRRGVDKAEVARIEAELRARTISQMPPSIPQQPQYQQPMPPSAPPIPQQPQYQQPMPPSAPPIPQQSGLEFQTFMVKLSEQMQKRDGNGNPLIDTNYLVGVTHRLNQQLGTTFTTITEIAGNQNAIDTAVAILSSDGRWN